MNDHAKEWDERYASSEHLWIAEPDPALVEAASGLRVGRCLDIGAGEGRNSLFLASRGWDITAVDYSKVALDRFGDALSARGLHGQLIDGDIRDVAGDLGEFDLVIIANIHPGLADREELYKVARSLLLPGGVLFLIGHHKDSFGIAGPPDLDRLLDEAEMQDQFPDFEVIQLKKVVDVSDFGHSPAPSLVFVARKPKTSDTD